MKHTQNTAQEAHKERMRILFPGTPAVEHFAEPKSTVTDSVKPFQVRASCGHVVIRKMREATAGVPYTPETILDAPNGRACPTCEEAS